MKRGIFPRFAVAALLLAYTTHALAASAAQRPTIAFVVDGIKRAERAFFDSGQLTMRYARTISDNMPPERMSATLSRGEWLLGRDKDAWYLEATAW